MPQIKIADILSSNRNANARWKVRANAITELSDEARKRMLGVEINPAKLAAEMSVASPAAPAAVAFAPAVDWRNRNGNHVTSPKDQGGCGSCVSFCTTGLTESMASIEKGQRLDLSEADLHFCSSHGASCSGWWPNDALGQIQSRGIVDEASFPYSSAFTGSGGAPVCKSVTDRASKAVKITNFGALVSAADRKNHLTNIGPCSAVLEVYDDFFAYANGVYHHVSGGLAGLHCVLVIGYSEADQCWICKNSWGLAGVTAAISELLTVSAESTPPIPSTGRQASSLRVATGRDGKTWAGSSPRVRRQCPGRQIGSTFSHVEWTLRHGIVGGTVRPGTAGRAWAGRFTGHRLCRPGHRDGWTCLESARIIGFTINGFKVAGRGGKASVGC